MDEIIAGNNRCVGEVLMVRTGTGILSRMLWRKVHYWVGLNGRGSIILVFMVLTRGTVLATTSFHSGYIQVFSRHCFLSARLSQHLGQGLTHSETERQRKRHTHRQAHLNVLSEQLGNKKIKCLQIIRTRRYSTYRERGKSTPKFNQLHWSRKSAFTSDSLHMNLAKNNYSLIFSHVCFVALLEWPIFTSFCSLYNNLRLEYTLK